MTPHASFSRALTHATALSSALVALAATVLRAQPPAPRTHASGPRPHAVSRQPTPCPTPSRTAGGAGSLAGPVPGVIDVHWHAAMAPGDLRSPSGVAQRRATMAQLDSLGATCLIVNGVPDALAVWTEEYPDRVIPTLLFPCENGIATNFGRPCFPGGAVVPDTAWLRAELRARRLRSLGEITAQSMGIAPDDERLEPYFALAEEFDVPVAIHVGIGPPAAAYPESPVPVKSPNFRAAAGRPFLLERVLLKHKRLRLSIMHAGWPLVDETISLLYHHPNVYVDVGVLQWAIPPQAFRGGVRKLVEAGYADRVMLGSDSGVEMLRRGIQAVQAMEFLTPEQRRGILCRNAARFYRLDSMVVCP